MRNHKRSAVNFSIKTGFQIKLVIQVMLIVLSSTAVTSAVFYFYADKEIGDSLKQFHITARNFQDYLVPAILTSGIFGLIIAFAVAIFVPHRFAGPLYRIESDLNDRICKGDLTVRFNLRGKDQYRELAGSLNRHLDQLRGSMKDIRAASQTLSTISSSGENISSEALKDAIAKLNQSMEAYKVD